MNIWRFHVTRVCQRFLVSFFVFYSLMLFTQCFFIRFIARRYVHRCCSLLAWSHLIPRSSRKINIVQKYPVFSLIPKHSDYLQSKFRQRVESKRYLLCAFFACSSFRSHFHFSCCVVFALQSFINFD